MTPGRSSPWLWWLFAPESLPHDFVELRNQWEYAHATRAILQIVGLASVLAETGSGKDRSV